MVNGDGAGCCVPKISQGTSYTAQQGSFDNIISPVWHER